jgi:hypothetical protein
MIGFSIDLNPRNQTDDIAVLSVSVNSGGLRIDFENLTASDRG